MKGHIYRTHVRVQKLGHKRGHYIKVTQDGVQRACANVLHGRVTQKGDAERTRIGHAEIKTYNL